MTTQWNPSAISDDLLALTNRLGEPDLDLVILAEGNTSEVIGDDLIAVKSSGSYMSTATKDDFVTVAVSEVVEIIENPAGTQEQLTHVLDAGMHNGVRRRGSIETLVHASVRAFSPARFVAHSHPTPVISLLASVHAEDAFAVPAYSDEVVVIGTPLFVPYAPGTRARARLPRASSPPRGRARLSAAPHPVGQSRHRGDLRERAGRRGDLAHVGQGGPSANRCVFGRRGGGA